MKTAALVPRLGPGELSDRDNVWIERLAGRRMVAGDKRLALGLTGGYLSFILLWVAGLLTVERAPVLLDTAGSLCYYFPVVLAMLAPSLGALARRRLDYDPLFKQSLTSPVPDRQYVVALAARILRQSAFLTIPAFIAFAGTYLVLLLGEAKYLTALNRANGYAIFLGFLDFFSTVGGATQANPSRHVLLLWFLFGIAALANYFMGLAMNSSVLAMFCQRDPQARAKGGAWTALLLTAMGALLYLRLELIDNHGRESLTIALLIAAEVFLLAARVFVTAKVWNRIRARAIDDSRAWIVGEG